ncbi:hypothetical protein, conserved [Eimeria tenella]|uniref:Uncharacterized protein n=1 Tax=Eimeria tenella TaxID=5802 RepID=U6L3U4_EIMTE|nr:hypothetical protein, conserved [Eimeria tenella]CDJ44841.1 hypothetical protein, conserved [Eimeria tenella]|eukprot:XP_013235589.1 hypothetical protein, conserved [Eimeria tenella]
MPTAAALSPEATTARSWSDCFVLHPPQQQQQQQEDGAERTDPHLLLLLSLLRPDLWPPLKLSDTLQQVTQEDFLHYRLMLLLAQDQQQQQQQQQRGSDGFLLRGLRSLVSKVKLQGPLFFDPQQQHMEFAAAAAAGHGGGVLHRLQQQQQQPWCDPQQRIAAALHVNFTYAWLLTLCGGLIDALLWLLRTYPFLRRVALVLLLLCYRFGCFESAALLHLSSEALRQAAEAACGAPAAAGPGASAAAGFDSAAAAAAAAGGGPWSDEAWAVERQQQGAPGEGPLATFLAEDLAAAIGSTFGCTDTPAAQLASRLLFAAVPSPAPTGLLRCSARAQLKALLLAAMDRGLLGTAPLAKVFALSLLPLFWSVPLLPAVVREAYGALTRPGVLLGEGEAGMSAGLLETLLLQEPEQQLRRPQQQRLVADCSSSSSSSGQRAAPISRLEDELWGSYFVLLDADSSSSSSSSKKGSGSPWADFDCEPTTDSSSSSSSSEELQQRRRLLEEHPFIFLLHCALRHEAKRRGDLRAAVAASWLLTDERNAAEALTDALSSQLFADFNTENSHQRRELKAFFLHAFNVLKRSSARVPRRLDLLAARGLFFSLLSSERFFEAMHAFNNMQQQLR